MVETQFFFELLLSLLTNSSGLDRSSEYSEARISVKFYTWRVRKSGSTSDAGSGLLQDRQKPYSCTIEPHFHSFLADAKDLGRFRFAVTFDRSQDKRLLERSR